MVFFGRQLRSLVPGEILHVFAAAENLNLERNELILAEAVHAASLLNQIGIQPVALKGLAYLLTGVYPNAACRYLADIDLLLPANQLPHAVTHLYRNGYFENSSDHFIHLRHHYPGIRRAGRPHLELHHQVGQGICNRLLPAKEMLTGASPLSLNGATFLIPSPTHLVNHLILHSQLAHPYQERIFPPLRTLLDLAQLQNRFAGSLDWLCIAKCYQRAGQSATLALHLQHCHQTLAFVPSTPSLLTEPLGFLLDLRWHRRLLLNRWPAIRFFDPIYLLMSLFSRRMRLVPRILTNPSLWPQVARAITRPEFYRNLFAV